jgi:hypothetical protein
MGMSKLPEITVTCRNDHDFTTRAKGGSTVRCKSCGAPTHVSRYRPTTAAKAREAARGDDTAGLRARWAAQQPVTGTEWYPKLDAADECPQCHQGRAWEPRRTMVLCPGCKNLGLPVTVLERAARSAEIATQAGTVATRAPSEAEQRAVRVRLRAVAQRMADRVSEWIDEFDPDGLSGGPLRLALDYRAEMAAWLPEIRAAKTEAELTEIAAEVQAIVERAETSGALGQVQRQREAIERASPAEDYGENGEPEPEPVRPALLMRSPAMVMGSDVIAASPALPVTAAAVGYRMVSDLLSRAELIERNGRCEFRHPLIQAAATRLVIGSNSPHAGTWGEQTHTVWCCSAHQDDAVQYVANLKWPYYRVEDHSRKSGSRVIVQ